jgi:hypothetical protein
MDLLSKIDPGAFMEAVFPRTGEKLMGAVKKFQLKTGHHPRESI